MYFIILFTYLTSCFHPVHLSFTNVEYIADKQEIQLTSRIFWDDMEAEIEAQNQVELNIGTPNEHPNLNQYIQTWYSKSLLIEINGKPIAEDKYILTLTEIDDISMRMVFTIQSESPKQIQIKNKILTALYADQSNLLIIKIKQIEESFSLSADNNVVTLEIE
jgi:hypothetical protein